MILRIPTPLKGTLTNEIEENGTRLPMVSFDSCIEASIGESALTLIEDFLSPTTGKKGQATMKLSISTFPRYLPIQINRYERGDNWEPQKTQCEVPVPRTIDLTNLRANRIHSGDIPLHNDTRSTIDMLNPDADLLCQLLSMGFPYDQCTCSLQMTKNAGLEQAIAWIFENNQSTKTSSPGNSTSKDCEIKSKNSEKIEILQNMGFSTKAAEVALFKCGNDIERAADWLFTYPGNLENLTAEAEHDSNLPASSRLDKSRAEKIRSENDSPTGKYILKAFISHIGKSTTAGHYICHINKSSDLSDPSKDQWVIFNDRKVALSKKPPLEHAYLALFENISGL